MPNIKLLEEEMKKKKITNSQIADLLNIDTSTWSRKKSKPDGISIGEAEKIVFKLGLSKSKASAIFLPNNSQ